MSRKFLDENGLLYFWQKIKSHFATISALEQTDSDLSDLSDRVDGLVSTGGEPNQNAFSTIKVGSATVSADTTTDTLTLTAGSNISISTDSANDGITINAAVPTKTSDLTNDSNYVTDAGYVHTDNNYTSTEKTKLSNIDDGADVNVIETVKVNNSALTVSNKAVNITVPTKASDIGAMPDTYTAPVTSVNGQTGVVTFTIPTNNNQLTNGAGYQTASDVSSAISTALDGITGISYQVVTSLPQTGEAGVIYLISNNGANPNIYDEYIYYGSSFEKIGTTDVDLSGYMLTTDMVAITNAEIDTTVAS